MGIYTSTIPDGKKPPVAKNQPSPISNVKPFNPPPIVQPVPAPPPVIEEQPNPIVDEEEQKVKEIADNSDKIKDQIDQISNEQERRRLLSNLDDVQQIERKKNAGLSNIPKIDHNSLEELFKYINRNDIWLNRRYNQENFNSYDRIRPSRKYLKRRHMFRQTK